MKRTIGKTHHRLQLLVSLLQMEPQVLSCLERENREADEMCMVSQTVSSSNPMNEHLNVECTSEREIPTTTGKMQQFDAKEARPLQNIDNSFRSRLPTSAANQIE